MEEQRKQMSETAVLGATLTFVGGFLDAYTYLCRGGVFANAQTGNVVLLGVHAAQRDWGKALYSLLPIAACLFGFLVAESVRHVGSRLRRFHWRQVIIGGEIVLLALAAFLPQSMNSVVNCTVSFLCALQVQAFRKVQGLPYASTMCTGNLRSAGELLFVYGKTKEKKLRNDALLYFAMIGLFALGAALGTILSSFWGDRAILVGAAVLVVVFALMFREKL